MNVQFDTEKILKPGDNLTFYICRIRTIVANLFQIVRKIPFLKSLVACSVLVFILLIYRIKLDRIRRRNYAGRPALFLRLRAFNLLLFFQIPTGRKKCKLCHQTSHLKEKICLLLKVEMCLFLNEKISLKEICPLPIKVSVKNYYVVILFGKENNFSYQI